MSAVACFVRRRGEILVLLGLFESIAIVGVGEVLYHVDLGAEPAPAAAQGLASLSPVFGGAPAAHGCARTTVLSMIRYSRSGSPEKC